MTFARITKSRVCIVDGLRSTAGSVDDGISSARAGGVRMRFESGLTSPVGSTGSVLAASMAQPAREHAPSKMRDLMAYLLPGLPNGRARAETHEVNPGAHKRTR